MEFLLPLLLTLPPGAAPVIWLSLGLGVGFTASMFMVAYFFASPQLVAVAREELAALVFTLFILMFFLGTDAFLNTLSTGLIQSALPPGMSAITESSCSGASHQCIQGLTGSHIQLALASTTVMKDKLISQYMDLYLFEALIGFLSTVSFPIASPFPAIAILSFSLAPFTGLVLLSNAHTVVVEAIGYFVTFMWAKEFLLIFTRDAIPLLLFPLGLVLRATPFYRRTGSTIIAVAFALYFVFPFSVILSNFMIFDIYKPADFAYNPMKSSSFDTDLSLTQVQGKLDTAAAKEDAVMKQFTGEDLVDTSVAASKECAKGNTLEYIGCSVWNAGKAVKDGALSFFETIYTIWRFMMGMTGDFALGLFTNPLVPSSASAGLYFFIIQEVLTISPFLILVTVTTVFEIIITMTMFRNVSMLIGGEAELIGVTKII
jgi:hypothetical protein